MIKRFLTFRVWLLIATLVFAILAINPSPWAEGVQIKSIKKARHCSPRVKTQENIFAINKEITTLAVKTALEELQFTLVNITLETNQGTSATRSTEISAFPMIKISPLSRRRKFRDKG